METNQKGMGYIIRAYNNSLGYVSDLSEALKKKDIGERFQITTLAGKIGESYQRLTTRVKRLEALKERKTRDGELAVARSAQDMIEKQVRQVSTGLLQHPFGYVLDNCDCPMDNLNVSHASTIAEETRIKADPTAVQAAMGITPRYCTFEEGHLCSVACDDKYRTERELQDTKRNVLGVLERML
ncbi:MAG: hypothetical protein Q7R96_02725 [Nanoarchaeota archaeon]|nr:hypothetical protein [Nanoarchaeota archaeon]